MASLEKIALLIFLLVMSSIEGYVLRLRTADHKRGACLADEQYYAIAPIQTLRKELSASYANGCLASVNESIDEFDCIPDVRCKRWSSNTAEARMSSYESSVADFGFLKTRGWNYLPEYITDGSDKFISPAIYIGQSRPAPVKIKMSILAEDKIQILLTGHEEWQGKPGVVIQLGAFGNWAALCSNMAKSLKESNCSDTKDFLPSITNFLKGSWVHLQLKTTEASYYLKTELTIDGMKTKHVTTLSGSSKLELKFATFRSSNKQSVIKLHNFNLTKLAQKTNYDFQFTPNKSSNLRSFTFKFVLSSLSRIKFDKKVEIDDSLLNEQKIMDNVTTKGGFKTYFLNIANTTVKEKIKISLTPDGNANLVSFGLLSKEPYEYYMDGNLNACQVLETDQVTSTNRIDTNAVIPDIPIESVCEKLKAHKCKGVEACSPSGCYCFSGHTNGQLSDNNCRDECKFPYFGPNCAQRIETECKKENYDIHTGCSDESQKPFRPPVGSKAVSVFEHQPTIVHIGAYSVKESPLLIGVTETSVRVSLKEEISAISSLMLIHFFKQVQIITRELETRKVWRNMTLDLRSASKELLIDGLNSGLEYTIKASVVDKDPTVPVEASTSAHFITKKCTQPTKSNILFINSLEETSIELIRKKKYTCDFSLYLKTPRGKENTTWERNYYKYTLRQIPNDAESLILEFDSGEPIEFMLFTSTPFLSGYDSVIVLLPCSTLLCILQSFMLMSLLPMLENKPKHL